MNLEEGLACIVHGVPGVKVNGLRLRSNAPVVLLQDATLLYVPSERFGALFISPTGDKAQRLSKPVYVLLATPAYV